MTEEKKRIRKAEYPLNSMGLGYRSTIENGPHLLTDVDYKEPEENYRYQYCGACAFWSRGECAAMGGEVSILGSCKLYIDMARELDLRHQAYVLRLWSKRDNDEKVEKSKDFITEFVEDLEILETTEKYIKQVGNKWCIYSHETGKNLGCSASKEAAQSRLDRMKRFSKKDIEVKIASMDEEQQIVYGIVLEPDEIDAHGDTVNTEEVERAAHKYALTPMVIGNSHVKKAKARPVETFVYSPEILKKVKPGSWVMAVKVEDEEMWQAVKDGKFTGFSIGALTKRTTLDDIEEEE